MSFLQASIILVVLGGGATWWLSGYNAHVIGSGGQRGVTRRLLRCLFSLVLLEGIFWFLWRFKHQGDLASALIPIPIFLALGFFWMGAVGEVFSAAFGKLLESNNRPAHDAKKEEEGLRRLRQLIQEGRLDEVMKLGERLRRSGDVNPFVLDAMLQQMGAEDPFADKIECLSKARRMREAGRFSEAEELLRGVLKSHPDYAEAAVLLIQIYVQDLGQGAKAAEVMRSLREQPGVSEGMLQFARFLLSEAGRMDLDVKTSSEPVPEAESVDTLISQWRFSSAITLLKDRVRVQPEDFEAWSKLAEVNGQHCGRFQEVERIIRLMEMERHFSPEQIQSIRDKLKEWRATWNVANQC